MATLNGNLLCLTRGLARSEVELVSDAMAYMVNCQENCLNVCTHLNALNL